MAGTIFQAASIGKPVAALVALRLVEQGTLALDENVNTRLKRWQLPPATTFSYDKVTLRQLLSHTAGTSVSGFDGYSPGSGRPTLVQILNGRPPANNVAVRVETPPGKSYNYSGGGYMVVQAMIEDSTNRRFEDLAREEILAPLGMTRSAFVQPLGPLALGNAAAGHANGRPVLGKTNVYPELAAAGLWSTPTDLARMLIDVRDAAREPGHIVSPATAAAMRPSRASGPSLGFAWSGSNTARRFGHNGSNLGFRNQAWIDEASGDGIVVMTNAEEGMTLAEEITRAVAEELGWTLG